jgi:hypothetical protein
MTGQLLPNRLRWFDDSVVVCSNRHSCGDVHEPSRDKQQRLAELEPSTGPLRPATVDSMLRSSIDSFCHDTALQWPVMAGRTLIASLRLGVQRRLHI